MATVLKQVNPGYIDRHGVGADFLDKTVDAIRMRYNSTPLQGSQFFRTASATGGTYREVQAGTKLPLPLENEDTDDLPFVTPWKGFPKSLTIATYRLAVQAERSLPEDAIHGEVRRLASGLMNTARILLEFEFANVFNNATSASYVGADGVALASDSHPFERYSEGTYDNYETAAALTTATFNTARKNMRRRKDEWGYPNPLFPGKLVVVPDIEMQARQIMNSSKVAENALNATNPWAGECEIVVWDYLTSTTAWFLVGKVPEENRSTVFVQEVAPNLAPTTGSDTSTDIIWGERLRMRYAVGFTVPREYQYNAGA